MRADHAALYVWLVVVRWTEHLVGGQALIDEVISDDGSGDLDPVAEVNIEVKDTFRDLICFQCSGGECPSRHYHEPLRHMVVSCQACYKEWDHVRRESTRKCFYPSDLTELNHSNMSVETAMCGVIERGARLSYYCFCYLDYCNHGDRSHPAPAWGVGLGLLTLCYLLYYHPPDTGGSTGRGRRDKGTHPHRTPPAT